MVFFLKKVHNRIDQLDQNLKSSFERVKSDNENLYAWIRYLNNQSELQQEELLKRSELVSKNKHHIDELKRELAMVPKSKQELRTMVDEVCSFDAILGRLKHVENRIEQLEVKHTVRKPAPVFAPVKQTSALKEKVLKRIAKNSKEYIKSVIKGIIRKYGKISALQLREMVVDERGLCSKSSFYRILEELEAEKIMNLVSQGKEKVYISTQK